MQLYYEQESGGVVLYAVEMACPSKQPMVLIDAVLRALRENNMVKADLLAQEYWQPTQPWKFWEYTSSKISTVRDQLKFPDEIAHSVASMDYSGDRKRVDEFLGQKAY